MIMDEGRRLLQSTIVDALRAKDSLAAARRRLDQPDWIDDALWRVLRDELGLVGVHAGEDVGGAGGGLVEAVVAVGSCAKLLAPVPLMSSIAAVDALSRARASAMRDEVLAAAVSGELAVSFVPDPATGLVVEGSLASGAIGPAIRVAGAALVVPAIRDHRPVLAVVDPADVGVRTEGLASLDPTRRFARWSLASVPVTVLEPDVEAATTMREAFVTLLCADSLGAVTGMLDDLLAYARQRYAFGRPIGSFQAFKHQLVDLWIAVQSSRVLLLDAASAVDESRADAPLAVAAAEAYILPELARAAVQIQRLYGGVGFTWEHHAHLFAKRIATNAAISGTSPSARSRMLELAGLGSVASVSASSS